MAHNERILVVDDEPINLEILCDYLEYAGFEVVTASDGNEAWEILRISDGSFKAILLDRMMPNLDGMGVLRKLKSCPDLCEIPVIMQTAAADKQQIAEGIEAGVFYYLTKPYTEAAVVALIKAAIDDRSSRVAMRDEVRAMRSAFDLVEDCSFNFSSIEDVSNLTPLLSSLFPAPERVLVGISELLINAVEHGNLGIAYAEKTELMKNGSWRNEVSRRLRLPENAGKRVRVDYSKGPDEIRLYIRDEGGGFDWRKYLVLDPERASDPHGRGIAISRLISFDRLEFSEPGNEVCAAVKRLS